MTKRRRRTEDGLLMDLECVSLVDAINEIPGLSTVESCCGHGKKRLYVCFYARQVENLYLLTRIVERIAGGWSVLACCTDRLIHDQMSVVFILSSNNIVGDAAFANANAIAHEIRSYLKRGVINQDKALAEDEASREAERARRPPK